MAAIDKYIKTAAVISGTLNTPADNEPSQYGDRAYPYFGSVASRHREEYAKYASNYMRGEAQGIDLDHPDEWISVTIRMADLVKTSAAMQRQFDGHKMVLFDRQKYSYIPRGAKLKTMGSVWLCTNPENISGGDGIGVFQRCNQTWNHLDWYGNVLKEPIVYETEILRANASDPQYNTMIVKGYYNIKAQYNSETAQIEDNTRMIFGRSAYIVTGFSSLEQEFTGDDDSIRFVQFTIRRDEINNQIDDKVNRVAGGLTFAWDISLSGPGVIPLGTTGALIAQSKRCGEVVESTEDRPISYLWSSSDESVATVDEYGVVTPISEGECVITATLAQNENISQTINITISESQENLTFTATPPASLRAYESATIAVTLPTGGTGGVEWGFAGADPTAYTATTDETTATIKCWKGSVEPLVITALYGDKMVSTRINLIGI